MKNMIIVWSALLLFVGCSPKLRYPVEEIKRPLSLPPKNWGMSLGIRRAWANYLTEPAFLPHTNIPLGHLPYTTYPYQPLFNGRMELHFTLLNLKFYPVHNVVIEDSAICMNGPNLAVGGGMPFEAIDVPFLGLSAGIPWNAFVEFKAPLSGKLWAGGEAILYNRPDQDFPRTRLRIQSGLGYQFNRKLYGTVDISGSYFRAILPKITHILRISGGGFDEKVEKVDYEVFGTELPIQLGYNFDKHWKLFLTGLAGYTSSHDAFYAGGGAGFDVYW